MSQATHVYRNTRNDRLGEMTEEQAALWPDLLVRVDAVEPEPELNDAGDAPDAEHKLEGPKAVHSARFFKKD